MDDEALVRELVSRQVPLTVCPLSNVKLGVFPRLEEHTLRQMLERGLCVTVNSDDPAYFGGYIADNLIAAQQALHLTAGQIYQLTRNAIHAAFLPEREKPSRDGRAATLGGQRREVTAGALLFIPHNEWVGLGNTGQETIRVDFIFLERELSTPIRGPPRCPRDRRPHAVLTK